MDHKEYLEELTRIHEQLEELIRHTPLGVGVHPWTKGRVSAFSDMASSCLWQALCAMRAHDQQVKEESHADGR